MSLDDYYSKLLFESRKRLGFQVQEHRISTNTGWLKTMLVTDGNWLNWPSLSAFPGCFSSCLSIITLSDNYSCCKGRTRNFCRKEARRLLVPALSPLLFVVAICPRHVMRSLANWTPSKSFSTIWARFFVFCSRRYYSDSRSTPKA